jgi:threonine/homoserine/homoserine lactone efflux protein
MLEGITAGFILSLTLYPGTVWLTKVGMHGSRRQVFAVGLGFALSQWLWLMFSVPGMMLMTRHLSFVAMGMHVFAAFVLGYMSWKSFRSERVSDLEIATLDLGSVGLFRSAFVRSLAMPMRLPTAMALLLSTGAFVNHAATWQVVPSLWAGVTIGVLWWWLQFSGLAAFFVKQVPVRITLKSLNKIRPFCGVLYLFLAVISLLLIK